MYVSTVATKAAITVGEVAMAITAINATTRSFSNVAAAVTAMAVTTEMIAMTAMIVAANSRNVINNYIITTMEEVDRTGQLFLSHSGNTMCMLNKINSQPAQPGVFIFTLQSLY